MHAKTVNNRDHSFAMCPVVNGVRSYVTLAGVKTSSRCGHYCDNDNGAPLRSLQINCRMTSGFF